MNARQLKGSMLILLIMALPFLESCLIPSIEPLYTSNDVTYDEVLFGEWMGNKSVWKFEKRDNRAYYLSYREGNDPVNDPSSCSYADFEVHLVQVGEDLYLDFFPINYLNTENLFLLSHLIEAHSFARIAIGKNELNVSFIDYTWLDQILTENPELVKHFRVNNNIVLNAGTEDLQDFVKKYAKAEGAFTSEVTLKRLDTP